MEPIIESTEPSYKGDKIEVGENSQGWFCIINPLASSTKFPIEFDENNTKIEAFNLAHQYIDESI